MNCKKLIKFPALAFKTIPVNFFIHNLTNFDNLNWLLVKRPTTGDGFPLCWCCHQQINWLLANLITFFLPFAYLLLPSYSFFISFFISSGRSLSNLIGLFVMGCVNPSTLACNAWRGINSIRLLMRCFKFELN